VKWAESLEVASCRLQRDVVADECHQVDTVANLCNRIRRLPRQSVSAIVILATFPSKVVKAT
jgi:hypothetical protein